MKFGRFSKTLMDVVAAMPVMAMAGVTMTVTSSPAMTLKPNIPAIAPSTPAAFEFWADIDSRVRDGIQSRVEWTADMPTWEYLTTPLMIHNTTAILNTWGNQGWELVQVVQGPEGGL